VPGAEYRFAHTSAPSCWSEKSVANPEDATAHELILRFQKAITLRAGQRMTLTVDSGGAKKLALLNRIRFAFRHRAIGAAQ